MCVISGFRLEVDENCALLSHYKACRRNSLPTFRDKLSVPSSRAKKFYVGPDSLSRNVGNKLPLHAM